MTSFLPVRSCSEVSLTSRSSDYDTDQKNDPQMDSKHCVKAAVKLARAAGQRSRPCAQYNTFFSAPRYFPHVHGRSCTIRNFSTAAGSSKDDDVVEGFADVPGVKTAGEKMIIMFTCTVCDTRSARKISKTAYTQGIVMVRCGGCKNRHLIADRMGVFEDSIDDDGKGGLAPGTGWDIQKYLAKEMGENSRFITDENVYELTVEDIVGAKAAAKLESDIDKK